VMGRPATLEVSKMKRLILCAAVVLLGVGQAEAATAYYDDESEFLAAACSVTMESFEVPALDPDTHQEVTQVVTDYFTATQASQGGIFSVENFDGHAPFFPTDGVQVIAVSNNVVNPGSDGIVGTLNLDFNTPINCFGVNIIDFEGIIDGVQPALLLFRNDLGQEHTIAESLQPAPSGNVIFFGLVNDASVFSHIEIESTGLNERIRFDEAYFGRIPEPSTLALMGVAAVGFLAYAWRRRKRAG